jgi:hypothetical protein
MRTNPEPNDRVIPEGTYSSPIKIDSGRIDRKFVVDFLEAQRWMFGVNSPELVSSADLQLTLFGCFRVELSELVGCDRLHSSSGCGWVLPAACSNRAC